jgi:hypothetical protein
VSIPLDVAGQIAFIAVNVDLPTFVTLVPQVSMVAVRSAPSIEVALRKTEATGVLEQPVAAVELDSSMETSARVEPQTTTISVEKTESDVTIDPSESTVELDQTQTGALVDA